MTHEEAKKMGADNFKKQETRNELEIISDNMLLEAQFIDDDWGYIKYVDGNYYMLNQVEFSWDLIGLSELNLKPL